MILIRNSFSSFKVLTIKHGSHTFTGNANEAIHLYRNALQVIKDSNYVALDDSTMEKMRVDLAELLHVVGR